MRLAPDDLVVFKYEDEGISTLEDGLYTTEENLDDPEMVDKLARFVRASMKGWKYAEEHPDEAVEIMLENDATGARTEQHQKRMMGEIVKLTQGADRTLDETAFERSAEITMEGGMITAVPEGAYTHVVTDKALQ